MQRLVGFQRNQFGQAVAQGKRQLQHTPHIAYHGFGRHRAKGYDLAHRLFAVFFAHIFNHAPAIGLAEVNIKVGHGHALGVEKTFKQQRVFKRV